MMVNMVNIISAEHILAHDALAHADVAIYQKPQLSV